MKIYLDSANVKEIMEATKLGILDGVTTNPTLISKEKRPFKDVIADILAIVKGPVNVEAMELQSSAIVEEAKVLSKLGPNIVIKIPMGIEGLKAVRILEAEGIPTNLTLCFTPLQALFAAKAGASYVSPFIGRLDDRGARGIEIIRDIKTIFSNYGFKTQVIVASIRNPLHVLDAALIGADIATIPFDTFQKLVDHPLTDLGIQTFKRDFDRIPG